MHSLKHILCFLFIIFDPIRGQIPDKLDIEEAEQRYEEGEATKDEENPGDNVETVTSARVVLDSDNFRSISQNGYTFVKYYAPWCHHCVQMAAEWNDLANHFHKKPLDGVKLVIGDVDCTSPQGAILCTQEKIDGYPTLKLYKYGAEYRDYKDDRDFQSMRKFLKSEIMGEGAIEINEAGVHTLNDFTFKKFHKEAGEDTPVVVKFYAPWCSACIALEQTYKELASRFIDTEMEDVKFAEVNCMDTDSLETCSDEGVEEFPSVYMYKDGELEDIYGGDRSLKDLVNFVWETVDQTQVEEEDGFSSFGEIFEKITMGGFRGGAVEEEEEETEDCECGEPGCICDDEEEDSDENDDEESEDGEEYEEDSDENGETDREDKENIDGDSEENNKDTNQEEKDSNSKTIWDESNLKHTEL